MACSCGKTGSYSFTQVVQQDGGHALPSLKYLHCKYKEQFEALFAQVGIVGSESNLKTLAELYERGGDVSGEITGANGQPIYFSIDEVLRKIDKSRISNNACSI